VSRANPGLEDETPLAFSLALLTPTPEPASAELLPGGAALLGLRRRR